MKKDKSALATWMLLLGVGFWGGTFVFMKQVVEYLDPYSFLSVRFLISAVLISAIFHRRFRHYNRDILIKGAGVGAVLAASMITQTIGIKHTTASSAGFITGLSVVSVPVIVSMLDRRLPGPMQCVSVLLAFAGLLLLTMSSGTDIRFGVGECWVLACALLYGIHIVLVGRWVRNSDAALVALTQFFTVAAISGIMGLALNRRIVISGEFIAWQAILFCAVFAGAYTYTAQVFFQKHISEIKAVIIYSLEPMFAAVIAFLYLHEKLPARSLVGGGLIMTGMILADLKLKKKTAN